MLSLTRRYTFSSAHRLCNPAFSEEDNRRYFGACYNLHGHNYTLEVSVSGKPSPETGMIIDIRQLDQIVKLTLLTPVDHKYLDEDVPFLSGILSTVENVAQVFYQQLLGEIPHPAKLHRIRLYESEKNWIEVVNEENHPE